MPYPGCHVSIGKGYYEAARAAHRQGASAFQYFPKNPRSLTVKSWDATDTARCARYCGEHGLQSIAHSSYPANLAADEPEQMTRVVDSLRNDLEIAEACGSLGVVVHFGIYKGDDLLQGYRNIIRSLDRTLEGWQGRAKLLIENQSGEHARMGMTVEELAQVRQLSRQPEGIGYCLDTCHLYASGQWNGQDEASWLRRAQDTGVLAELVAVHLNDSLHPSGSYRDRHAGLGEGCIGTDALRRLVTAEGLRHLPLVLETPKEADGTHREQLRLVRSWLD
ncbi:deoxyribonuclease IV [Paenibacillus daejeonensis]|uniref:deoxyribonuclease IV n=1 Tax=Paenibacillus daejeonensis TaxID=135193 RepID=UPI00038108E7|nr:deoxyribonuclease IV [Paenibacillus daejeonensis]